MLASCYARESDARVAAFCTGGTMTMELRTQREAAERLRINTKAVRRLVREGRLPEVRLGPRLPRYRVCDLDALVVAA